jgi:hypothetical protein
MTERVSVATNGAQALNGNSYFASVSADGRFVAFGSSADGLDPSDMNGGADVFVRDRVNGTTERVSVSFAGIQGVGTGYFSSISNDGRFVAFASWGTDLVNGDTNGVADVFVRDRLNGTTERVSVDSGGAEGNGESAYYNSPSISADGRFVAFESLATNLVAGDTNGVYDIFVHDRLNGTTERVSVSSSGAQGNGPSGSSFVSGGAKLSADGRFVVLASYANNLVAGDTNQLEDVFVRDRDASGFTSLCDAGLGGVIACPCSNPPNGPAHGCDNSVNTGGAVLTAVGNSYLSMDSIVFTTCCEEPNAMSIVVQGDALVADGLQFGEGVRCVGGTLKRLYTKTALGGSITAPDFGAGDPSVSARSAALGDVIQAGDSRWYLVYYHDPNAVGPCSQLGQFNATQTAHVAWSL